MFIFPLVLLTLWVLLTSLPRAHLLLPEYYDLESLPRGAHAGPQVGTKPLTQGECCATLWDTVYSFSLSPGPR